MDIDLCIKLNNYFDQLDNELINLLCKMKRHGHMIRVYNSMLWDKNNENHDDFIDQMEKYTRIYFDPFSRNSKSSPKFNYTFKNGEQIETTLGQLNFFMWSLKKNIIHY